MLDEIPLFLDIYEYKTTFAFTAAAASAVAAAPWSFCLLGSVSLLVEGVSFFASLVCSLSLPSPLSSCAPSPVAAMPLFARADFGSTVAEKLL